MFVGVAVVVDVFVVVAAAADAAVVVVVVLVLFCCCCCCCCCSMRLAFKNLGKMRPEEAAGCYRSYDSFSFVGLLVVC